MENFSVASTEVIRKSFKLFLVTLYESNLEISSSREMQLKAFNKSIEFVPTGA